MAIETWEFSDVLAEGSAREAFAGEILEMAKTNKNIYLVTADVSAKNTKQYQFSQEFPERFVDVGIAEQNAVGVGAGIAISDTNRRVFINCFGPFLSTRSVEQVYLDGSYNHTNICVIGTHSGLTSAAGPTHCAIMDLGYMRTMPGMTVIAPADAEQIKKVIRAAVDFDGPIFVRCSRGIEPLVYENTDYEYKIGKSIRVKDGKDITLIGTGCMVHHCVAAAKMLDGDGIDARVIDMHTVKPLDEEAILKAASETGAIITVEDHSVKCGMGSAVAEVIAEQNDPKYRVQVKRLGVPDHFWINGGPDELYEYYGFDSKGIYKTAKELLGKE